MSTGSHTEWWLAARGAMGLAFTLSIAAPPSHTPFPAAAKMRSQAADAYGRLPMTFEPNQGQAEPSVKFLSRGGGFTLQLSATEAGLAFSQKGRGTGFGRRKGECETSTDDAVAAVRAPLGAGQR